MKKLYFSIALASLLFTSCGDKKETEVQKEVVAPVETVQEVKTDVQIAGDQLALGERLFTEKTCVSCHALDTKVIGPSIKDIVKIYDEKNGNLVQFLKGNSPAIVDTDPGQVAIMKANLDGFVKDMTPEELQAVAAYMRSKKIIDHIKI
ncbi:MAG: c-type cytochrome [Flavobacteriaceae bacterium]|nr:c-type cytochrome [Flavobacteriaceae bacterium]